MTKLDLFETVLQSRLEGTSAGHLPIIYKRNNGLVIREAEGDSMYRVDLYARIAEATGCMLIVFVEAGCPAVRVIP